MAQDLVMDREKTAVLIMDYQAEIVSNFVADPDSFLTRAASVLQSARAADIPVIHVVVTFREGYADLSARNKVFAGAKEAGWFLEGAAGTQIHTAVAPEPNECVVTKRRVGAFSGTDLEVVLTARDIDTLVLLGITTSGAVLTTVRSAADLDYRLVVIADCCTDMDEEVHRVLTEKIFPPQATVLNAQEFLAATRSTVRT